MPTTELRLPIEQLQLESPLLLSCFSDIQALFDDLKDRLLPLISAVHSKELDMSQGISLLQVKCQSLLSYMSYLTQFVLLKISGQDVESELSVVDALVELRVVIEKLKPLEQKLKYQIDKLIKSAVLSQDKEALRALNEESGDEKVDPLSFKPNPDQLAQGHFFYFL
jgi:U3 small nucleolar ribonucleoprotein protein LCP5